ncbi:MAG: type III pantothenate kinase [Gammaproteobacteria bacterium]|nr:type III pantothenate kinase [Gammaproteobacteria bacterium]MCW8909801.1 type III pantothenate kinase [Gammaproteobacteria bacterium]MCW9004002.1 type III pantothenate kinase [Gammaproteobacteria bacterium]MCW9056096.1 type III pantothenate kinase [Gammaproteobacteria bacterium]
MLSIDIGNSCLKWAFWEGDKIHQKGAECYQLSELDELLNSFFSTVPVQGKIYISCVAGTQVKEKVDLWFSKNWQVNSVYVVSQKQCSGLINAYTDAESLGVDRWYAMIGAWIKYKRAFCIIDCGTAVTVDVVDNSGQHQGGLIIPGLNMMRSALQQGTQGIENVSGQLNNLARNTGDAVNSGCSQVLVLGLESLLNKYKETLGKDLLCIVTGGDGQAIAEQFTSDYIYEPDLILYGLKEAATAGL